MNDKVKDIPIETILKVKKIVKKAKDDNLIKPHTEAFKNNSVKLESHHGDKNYFCS